MSDRDRRALANRYGPYAVLVVVVGFMLWVRLIPADHVITDSAVFFSGNDPWYHNRMVHFSVRNFPTSPSFDPWSYYPYGTGRHSGFGGLFDQLIALGALVVGLGNPDRHLVDVVTAIAPPVFGALTAIPAYVIARWLTDRWWALASAGILALSGGGLFARTIVGTADHQSAEALFGAIAVAGFAYAFLVASRQSPMLEDVSDRNWRFLRKSTLAGIVGGVAVAAYLALWPAGVMLLFTFGVFLVIQLSREHVAGRPTDPLSLATIVSMVTAGVLTLLNANTYSLQSTAFSLLQPLAAFGLAVGAALLLGLSRYAEREGHPRERYPVAIGGLLATGLVISWVAFPTAIDLLGSLFTRVYSFGVLTTATAGTVAEIQPASLQQAFNAYGTFLALAVVGFALLVHRVYRDPRPLDLLVALWSLSMFAAYFTMARFGYYFSVNVAILGGLAVWWIADRWLDIEIDLTDLSEVDVDGYQVIGILVILILVIPGNVVAVGSQRPVWEEAENPALYGTDQAWYDSLDWMEANTPRIPLEYYGTYDRPSDGDYDYPPAAYGVMSWWDYGHWITVIGERIPYANPFQQNPRPASAYLQATNETRANLILEALPGLHENPSGVADMSAGELRSVVDRLSQQQADEDGRYVIIDDQMAADKFPAITQWAGPGYGAYISTQEFQIGSQPGQTATVQGLNDRYANTMLSRLYFDDARGLGHYRLVHESSQRATIVSVAQQVSDGGYRTVVLNRRLTGSLFRAVQQRRDLSFFDASRESRVKTYERVEGATLEGSVPATTNATTVFATIPMRTNTGRNFTYLRRATIRPDGTFSIRVPYATDDEVSVAEGGTDTDIRARAPYTVSVGHPQLPRFVGQASVPESAVYEGRTIRVELERPSGNASATNGTASVDASLRPVGDRTAVAGP